MSFKNETYNDTIHVSNETNKINVRIETLEKKFDLIIPILDNLLNKINEIKQIKQEESDTFFRRVSGWIYRS